MSNNPYWGSPWPPPWAYPPTQGNSAPVNEIDRALKLLKRIKKDSKKDEETKKKEEEKKKADPKKWPVAKTMILLTATLPFTGPTAGVILAWWMKGSWLLMQMAFR